MARVKLVDIYGPGAELYVDPDTNQIYAGNNDSVETIEGARDLTIPAQSKNYREWVGRITQSSTGAPVAVVSTNTLGGDLVFTYSDVGRYVATLAGVFTESKTHLFISTELDVVTGQCLVETNTVDDIHITTVGPVAVSEAFAVTQAFANDIITDGVSLHIRIDD